VAVQKTLSLQQQEKFSLAVKVSERVVQCYMLYVCRDWICITFHNHTGMPEGRNIWYLYVHSFKHNTAT